MAGNVPHKMKSFRNNPRTVVCPCCNAPYSFGEQCGTCAPKQPGNWELRWHQLRTYVDEIRRLMAYAAHCAAGSREKVTHFIEREDVAKDIIEKMNQLEGE